MSSSDAGAAPSVDEVDAAASKALPTDGQPRWGWGADGKRLTKVQKKELRQKMQIAKKAKWREREREVRRQKVAARSADLEARLAAMSAEERAAYEAEEKRRRDELYDARVVQSAKLDAALAGSGGLRVAIDLSYGDRMSAKEQASLARQLTRCWGANRRAAAPCGLHLTGLGSCPAACLPTNAGRPDHLSWKVGAHDGDVTEAFPLHDLVFLSPDASEVLTELDPSKVYVIGGLVDASVQKQQSLQKACGLGARAVRLPLAEHAVVAHGRLPLTLTAVLELLLTVHAGGEWADAVRGAVAPRLQRDEGMKRALGRENRRKASREGWLNTWGPKEGGVRSGTSTPDQPDASEGRMDDGGASSGEGEEVELEGGESDDGSDS